MDINKKEKDFNEVIQRLASVKDHEEFDKLVREIKRFDLYVLSLYRRYNNKKDIRERLIDKVYEGDEDLFSMVPDTIIDNNLMSETEITSGMKNIIDYYFEDYLLKSFNGYEIDRHLMSIDGAYNMEYKFDDINDFQPVFLKMGHHGLMSSMIYSCVKYLHYYFRKTNVIILGKNDGLSSQLNECKRAFIHNCDNSSFDYISVSKPGWYLKLKKIVKPKSIVCIGSDMPELFFNDFNKVNEAKDFVGMRTSNHTFDVETYSFFERSVQNFNATPLAIKHDGEYSIKFDNEDNGLSMPFNKWIYWPAIDLYDIKNISKK